MVSTLHSYAGMMQKALRLKSSRYIALGFFFLVTLVTKNALAEGVDSCVRFSLEVSFPTISVGEKSSLFVKCPTASSVPIRNQVRPVYSQYEMQSMADGYLAIMDCLEIDPTLLFPKLMAESGFHTLIQNPNGDAGVGQLTKKAMRDVEANMGYFKQKILESKKLSCQKIKSFASVRKGFWQPIVEQSKWAVLLRQIRKDK